MDLAFVEEFDNIRSILQYMQAGGKAEMHLLML